MSRALLSFSVVVALTLSAQARDDADPVRVKLDKAKAGYAAELEKFRQDIAGYFDRRDEAARKAGDKKAVDQIKAERKAFEERSELPASAPKAVKQKLALARATLERAYATAVKEYTMAKKDEAAAVVEEELAEFTKSPDPSDTRRRWVHAKGAFTNLGNGTWEEKSPDGMTYTWKETARVRDYVELHAVIFDVAYAVRLGEKTADYQAGKGSEFKPKFTGKWTN